MFKNINFYLNDRDRGGGDLAPPNAPPPLTQHYLTILMTERGGAIIFCRILATPPPQCPRPDATILNYLTDREGRGHNIL